ncbi:concanavalin A-like lectin/glucanase domain-containing protein [Naematelia encephala]|uniref:Concanavalin A-like lectin/glucanase domain-containing protein n=1 Tax=Naematelia encephala TaxID=71784 RepID=A0A1Y2AXQ5_9TREE|nr:concanavalin A-like lectin/glucanase domain-containing protein [Naematelia encephala]
MGVTGDWVLSEIGGIGVDYHSYVDHDKAFTDGLAFWTSSGVPGIQAEHWATLAEGVTRDSVRITSKALFAGGLFIIDLALMPWGCGVWPAFWMLGYDKEWPNAGEIDIVEGIQAMTNNHTTPGCDINQTTSLYRGTVANQNCDSSAGGTGCSIVDPSASSYGDPFNSAGGGVFAALWDGNGIKMWSWNRAQIPSDITNESPSPENWGTPVSAWDASTCNPYEFFSAQMLVLNIDLCGDWAGNDYASYSYCPGTCPQQIANPANLVNTVMIINYIKVFQQSGTIPIKDQVVTDKNVTGAGGVANPMTGQAVHIAAHHVSLDTVWLVTISVMLWSIL